MLDAHGEQPLRDFMAAYPDLTSHRYGCDLDLDEALAWRGSCVRSRVERTIPSGTYRQPSQDEPAPTRCSSTTRTTGL